MVTSLLYYRTDSNPQSGLNGVADPRNLPTVQVLEFLQPNRVLEGVQEIYENIITRQVSVNQSGIRRIFNRDDGMKQREFTITGRLEKGTLTENINKLIDFRTRLQRSELHPHGIIGFLSGNSVNFSVDPDADDPDGTPNNSDDIPATKGLMIGRMEIGYAGRVFRRLLFRVQLFYGGTHETVTVV